MTGRNTGWVKIGTNPALRLVLYAAGFAAIVAVAISHLTAQLAMTISGVYTSWLTAASWTFFVTFIISITPMLVFSHRPAHVNLASERLRVGWRTIPFSELRHVYRVPIAAARDELVIQLDVSRVLDARIQLVRHQRSSLTAGELAMVIAMLERAPIEPVAGAAVHAPLGDELGERGAAERLSDQVSLALAPFRKTTYSKPTVLAQLRGILDASREDEEVEPALLNPGGEFVASFDEPPVGHDHRRGFWGTLGRRFATHQVEVEQWLASEGAPAPRRFGGWRVLTWALLILAPLSPMLFFVGFASSFFIYAYYWVNLDPVAFMAWGAVAFFFWPFAAWLCLIVLQGLRIRRYLDARAGAMAVRASGRSVPESVHRFFGPLFPERSFGTQVYIYGLLLSLGSLVTGLVFLALSAGMVSGPYQPLPWHFAVGWPLVLAAAPLFAGVLWWQNHWSGVLARASVEWQLLRGE